MHQQATCIMTLPWRTYGVSFSNNSHALCVLSPKYYSRVSLSIKMSALYMLFVYYIIVIIVFDIFSYLIINNIIIIIIFCYCCHYYYYYCPIQLVYRSRSEFISKRFIDLLKNM